MANVSSLSGAQSIASLMASSGKLDIGQAGGSAIASVVGSGKMKGMTPEKIDAVSKDFESMFISQMVEQMFGDSSGDSAFGNSDTNDVYKGMLMEQYGKVISRSGGIGIASYVKKELLRQQEV